MNRAASLRLVVSMCVLSLMQGCFGGNLPHRPATQVKAEKLLDRAIRAELKNDSTEAERLLRSALSVASSIENTDMMAQILINLARLKRRHGAPGEAKAAVDAALKYLPAQGEVYAEAAQEKALLELADNNPSGAMVWAQKAVGVHGTAQGRRLNLVGRIMLANNDNAGAAATLQAALDQNHRDELAEEEANSLRMLGIVARRAKRTEEAEGLLTKALEIDKRCGLSSKIAMDLEELGQTFFDSNQLSKAVTLLERASEVNINGGRLREAASNQAAIGQAYERMGERAKAEAALRKSKEWSSGNASEGERVSRDNKPLQ